MGGGGRRGLLRGVEPERTEWEKYIRPAVVSAAPRELLIGADGVLDAITFELCKKIMVEL